MTGLPLVAEIVIWIAALPWVLGLWVSQTSWAEWLRILLVLCFAIGWTVVDSAPEAEHDGVAAPRSPIDGPRDAACRHVP